MILNPPCACLFLCFHSLPTDVASTIYAVGAKDDLGWTSLLQIYKVSLSEDSKSKILFALTCTGDANKLNR